MRLQDLIPRRLRAWVAEGLAGTALGDSSGLVDGERGWSRITGRKRQLDLDAIGVDTMIRVARYLEVADPLGGWLVTKPVEMAISAAELGYSVDVDPKLSGLEDEQKRKEVIETIRAYLDPFWEHPLFNIRQEADGLFTGYLVDGSLCLEITGHNSVTGTPQLDLIDAQQIPGDGVEPLKGRATVPGRVKVTGEGSVGPVWYEVVNVDPKTLRYPIASQPTAALQEGEAEGGQKRLCFYFRRTKRRNSMRGFSALLAPADWVDGLNSFLWNSLDRAKLLNCLVYDVEMTGAQKKDIAEKQADLAKAPLWQPNTHYVHNEREKLTTVTADLKSSDATTLARAVKNFILGSKSFPEGWYGEGGETNRATLSEQGDPTYRTLESYQKDARIIFTTILNYAYDQVADRQSNIPKRVDEQGRIVVWLTPSLPALSSKDSGRLASALTQIETGLKQSIDDGMLSEKTALLVFLSTLSQLSGIEVEPDEEAALIEAERSKREERQAVKDAERAAKLYALQRAQQAKGEAGEDGEKGDEEGTGEGGPPFGGQQDASGGGGADRDPAP